MPAGAQIGTGMDGCPYHRSEFVAQRGDQRDGDNVHRIAAGQNEYFAVPYRLRETLAPIRDSAASLRLVGLDSQSGTGPRAARISREPALQRARITTSFLLTRGAIKSPFSAPPIYVTFAISAKI